MGCSWLGELACSLGQQTAALCPPWEGRGSLPHLSPLGPFPGGGWEGGPAELDLRGAGDGSTL